MTLRVHRAYWACLLLGVVTTGCAGSATRFYTLVPSTPAQTAASPYAGAAIRVDAVHIPPALDRTELTREGQNGEVAVSDNDHWVAPVGELMQRALTQDLVARLPAGAVIFPDAPKPAGTRGLVVDVLAISHQGGDVVLDASWTMIPVPATGSQMPRETVHPHNVKLKTDESSPGVKGEAHSISVLIGQLADRISEDFAAPQ